MARNQKDFTYDNQLLFKDSTAVTSTGVGQVAASNRVIDLGASRVDMRVVCDVSNIKTSATDEIYTLQVQVSNSSTFANTIVCAASIPIGAATPTGNSAATVAGRYELQLANEVNGVVYRYARVRHVIAGTSPTITYSAYGVQQVL